MVRRTNRAADVERTARTVALCLATAGALTTERDQEGPGFISGSAGESEPPWNAEAAYAHLVPHHELRRLESELRAIVTGAHSPVRGGSAGNTQAALDTLARFSASLPDETTSLILAKMDRWIAMTLALRAVDRMAQWEPVPAGESGARPWCPHGCGPTLRSHTRTGVIACIKPSCAGAAGDRRPWGRMVGAGSGKVIEWSDGIRQPMPG
jgi:hypothetical protein